MSSRKQHFYRHLDHDSKLTVELDLRKVAEQLVSMNYGVHRLLSHLVDVRREHYEGDRLAEGIAALLEAGLC